MQGITGCGGGGGGGGAADRAVGCARAPSWATLAAVGNVDEVASGRQARDLLRGTLGRLRREELLLFSLWLIGVAACLGSGTGFALGKPLEQYLRFFSLEIVYVFAGSRVLFYLAERWRPEHRAARWLERALFGRRDGRATVEATDLELIRGTALLFVTLVIYSNLKIRIPLIGLPVDGDRMFADLDAWLLPDSWVPAVERWFREYQGVPEIFQSIYVHDYKYMVALIFLFYLRRDTFYLRWTFIAVCVTYLVAVFIALLVPSYGPCFLSSRFEWLRSYQVGKVQNWLAQIQYAVVNASRAGRELPEVAFAGISAFPSMHVGHMVILGVIGLFSFRWFAALMFTVCTGTFIATIGFGWHYVVDAFAGAGIAIGVTLYLRRAMLRWDARRAGPAPPPPPPTSQAA
jgi:hypothetical protein